MSNLVDNKNDGVNEGASEDDDIFTQDEKLEKEREQAAMEDDSDVVVCSVCRGEGTTLVMNDNDENERNFDTCQTCGGSGELLACDNETEEDEWERFGGEEEFNEPTED